MLRTILSVSGKPGLFKLISQGKNMLILETLDATKKRLPVYAHDKVISLGDIAMYTDDEELISLFKRLGIGIVVLIIFSAVMIILLINRFSPHSSKVVEAVNNKESLTASEKSAYNQYVLMWKDALAAKNEYAISDDGSQESIKMVSLCFNFCKN